MELDANRFNLESFQKMKNKMQEYDIDTAVLELQDDFSETALHFALKATSSLLSNLYAINYIVPKLIDEKQHVLLTRNRRDMLPPDDEYSGFQRDTPLHMALAMELSVSTLELLIDDKQEVLVQVNGFGTADVEAEDTPMHLAIKTHRAIDVIKLMMDTDSKVMLCKNNLKDTPLYCALRHSKNSDLKDSVNCEKVLSYLIKKCKTLGPDYFMIEGYGTTTPLYFAIELDAPMYVIKMLVQCDVRQILHVVKFSDSEDPEDSNFKFNGTPLHQEINGQCRLDVIKLIVNACGEVLQKKSYEGLTPLHFAVKRKRPFHIIEYLASKDSSVLLVDTKYEWDNDEESDGGTPLVIGISVCLPVNILKLLVDADLKVFTIRTDDGNYLNPMHYLLKTLNCTVAYAITVMEFLVPYCTLVSPDMRLALLYSDYSSPLDIYLTCQPRFPELLDYLIDEDEQVLKITNVHNEYPLFTALKHKMPYEVLSKLLPDKYLLQILGLKNIGPHHGTYLHYIAEHYTDIRVFKMLTKPGIIALDSPDRRGMTALHIARIQIQTPDILQLLSS